MGVKILFLPPERPDCGIKTKGEEERKEMEIERRNGEDDGKREERNEWEESGEEERR